MKRKTANIDIQPQVIELPAPGARWTPRRKRAVIEALDAGQISMADAFERYALTPEELNAWVKMFLRHGLYGLRGTRLQCYEPERRGVLSKFRSAVSVPLDYRPAAHRTDRHALVGEQ